ncbi:MAG: nucleoside phosphorylase [Herbinix sp.]|nr:nucleoside phosphorylase [Herbinix sp.]
MAVVKNAYPILEYDIEKDGVIKPNRAGNNNLPSVCVMTFFGEVLEKYVNENKAIEINHYGSEMRKFPIYEVDYEGSKICIIQAVVGSASIAMMTDFLIGYGVKIIITCGGCGVLNEIPVGNVIIPNVALRDEGASYHYLPPSRDIILDTDIVNIIKLVLSDYSVPYIECKTWTTDAFYRETPDMITYRKEEGCEVVEMECATIAAIARFRGVKFGQLLYSGDILTNFENYDERAWTHNLPAREKLFFLSLQVAKRVCNIISK